MPEPKLNALDKAQIAALMTRMCKRQIAGEHVYIGDLQKKVDRVIDRASKRQ
jgi:hypothetical protein